MKGLDNRRRKKLAQERAMALHLDLVRWYATTKPTTLKEVAVWLAKRGVVTAATGEPLHPTAVTRILKRADAWRAEHFGDDVPHFKELKVKITAAARAELRIKNKENEEERKVRRPYRPLRNKQ